MCGIVGLRLKNPALHPMLGELVVPMLHVLASRGPDSTGVAIYGHDASQGALKYSLSAPTDDYDWDGYVAAVEAEVGLPVKFRRRGRDAVLVTSLGAERGYQAIGHTRMATESAVTTEHSHPFAVAADLALVHNGSFSNYASVRRELTAEGARFDTDNDSEVAARYIAREMSAGADLADALRGVLKVFDGFFTLLVTSGQEFAVVRDSFACKPMVVAETADYVAVASEYVALADLPGVESAKVFEPMPEEIYTWQA